MICLKCGNEIKDNEQICSKCGYNKNTIPNNDNPFGVKNQGIYNPNSVNKEEAEEKLEHEKQFNELVEIYIGPMYYNFKKGKFSWCAFLLGPLYIAYRKMIGVSIIVYIIEMLITFLFGSKWIIYTIVSLIFRLFLGTSFKKIYFDDSIEKVGKIKQNNPDKGFNQLTEIVRVKGRTNILYSFLIIITLSTILTLIMMTFNIRFPESDLIRTIERLMNRISF
jgi:hypothetical protein